MNPLLRFGTIVLLISVFTPLEEIFDDWDTPGLSNDTEFALFTVVFSICLVLLVCKLVAAAGLELSEISREIIEPDAECSRGRTGHTFIFAIPPLRDMPLRI